MELTFNLGVGMVAVVPADRLDDALARRGRPRRPGLAGLVTSNEGPLHAEPTSLDRPGQVEMAGSYSDIPGFPG